MAGCEAGEAGEYRVRRVREVDAHGVREHEAQHEVLQRSALQLGALEPRLLAHARTCTHMLAHARTWRWASRRGRYYGQLALALDYYYDDGYGDCSSSCCCCHRRHAPCCPACRRA